MLWQQKLVLKIINKKIKKTTLKAIEIIPERVSNLYLPVYIQ